MNGKKIILWAANAVDSLSDLSQGPARMGVKAVAVLLRTLARVLERRTVAETTAMLEDILANGAKPLTAEELDEQERKIAEEFAAKG